MAKSLEDYRDVVNVAPPNTYTHAVYAADGTVFSIHKSAAEAQPSADKINGTIGTYTPNESHYWGTEEAHYDH